MSIVAALALVGGATFAFFTDIGSSNNNTFTSGTFDLQIKDTDEGFADTVLASTVSPASWAPGDSFVSFVCFKNNGSVPIQQILFALTSPDANNANNDLDLYVYVSSIELGPVTSGECNAANTVGSEALTPFLALFNSRFDSPTVDGKVTLREQLDQIDGANQIDDDLLDGLAAVLPQNGIVKLRVGWTFDSTAPTTNVAGKTVTINNAFTATQNELP